MAEVGATVQLAVDDATASVYDDIDNVISISPPSQDLGFVETTNLDSTGNKTFISTGLVDPGELSFEKHYDSSSFSRMQNMKDGTAQNWRITFVNGQTYTVSGYLKGAEIAVGGAEDLTTLACTVQLNGVPTLA